MCYKAKISLAAYKKHPLTCGRHMNILEKTLFLGYLAGTEMYCNSLSHKILDYRTLDGVFRKRNMNYSRMDLLISLRFSMMSHIILDMVSFVRLCSDNFRQII